MSVSHNKSLLKGLQVLKEVMNSTEPINANTLCARLDIDKSTMSRLITTLMSEEFIKYVDNTKEIVYADVMGNLSKKNRQELIVKHTENILNEVFSLTNECAYMTVYDEEMSLNLNQIDNSNRVLKNRNTIGSHTPLHLSAMGKVILAYTDIDVTTLNLEAFTSKTITQIKRLRFELAKIQDQGFAIADEEFEYGLRSLAIPYYSKNGEFIGAIGISGLANRLPIEKMEEYAEQMVKIASKNLISF